MSDAIVFFYKRHKVVDTSANKINWRVVIYIVVFLCLIVFFMWLGFSFKNLRLLFIEAKPNIAGSQIIGTGTLESVQEISLSFKVGGRILDLQVEEGSFISKGQVLGHLEKGEIQAKLRAARVACSIAQAGVRKVQAELNQARASSYRAKNDYERLSYLCSNGIVSKAELDASKEKVIITKAAIQSLLANKYQVEGNALLAKFTEEIETLNLGECTLLSPIDGIIVRKSVSSGSTVLAGDPVMIVANNSYIVRAFVDESSRECLRVGQKVKTGLSSHPGVTFPGRVAKISSQSDRKTHKIILDIEIFELPKVFSIGQSAEVRIETSDPPLKSQAIRLEALAGANG